MISSSGLGASHYQAKPLPVRRHSTNNHSSTRQSITPHLFSEPYHDIDQQILEPANQAVANAISPSTTDMVTTTAQPPKASLLGLPKELLNYIIALVVVEDPDAGLYTLLLEQLLDTRFVPRGQIRAFRTPALARTCTALEAIVLPVYYGQNTFTFCSARHAYHWLHQMRRGQGETSVRQIRVYFEQYSSRALGLGPDCKREPLGVYLKDSTDKLAVTVVSPFVVGACRKCRNNLLNTIEMINGRPYGRYPRTGESGLATLIWHFKIMALFPKKCTMCGLND
jgi:hypothetical protein